MISAFFIFDGFFLLTGCSVHSRESVISVGNVKVVYTFYTEGQLHLDFSILNQLVSDRARTQHVVLEMQPTLTGLDYRRILSRTWLISGTSNDLESQPNKTHNTPKPKQPLSSLLFLTPPLAGFNLRCRYGSKQNLHLKVSIALLHAPTQRNATYNRR